jgi:predicted metal-dependent enzyme (double-stranded beta helix superfamily)
MERNHMTTFSIDTFVGECIAANADAGRAGVKDLVDRVISMPTAIEAALGDTTSGPLLSTWHRSDELTILHIIWPPMVELEPHDHNMWAAIGVYGGREDNTFYRHLDDGRVEPHTEKTMMRGDSIALGADVVHSVTNPTREWTAAIHTYGGEFFTTPRTTWMGDNFDPVPFDAERTGSVLEAAAAAATE